MQKKVTVWNIATKFQSSVANVNCTNIHTAQRKFKILNVNKWYAYKTGNKHFECEHEVHHLLALLLFYTSQQTRSSQSLLFSHNHSFSMSCKLFLLFFMSSFLGCLTHFFPFNFNFNTLISILVLSNLFNCPDHCNLFSSDSINKFRIQTSSPKI